MDSRPDSSPAGQAATPPAPAPQTATPGTRPSVWAFAGGKGGVGRTLLAANLGIQLARSGRRVGTDDGGRHQVGVRAGRPAGRAVEHGAA